MEPLCTIEVKVLNVAEENELPRAMVCWDGWEGDVIKAELPLDSTTVQPGDRLLITVTRG